MSKGSSRPRWRWPGAGLRADPPGSPQRARRRRAGTVGRRALRVGALVALAGLAAGCAVDATVTVAVRDDGSGTVGVEVRADPGAVETAEAGGGTLDSRVRLSDLAPAGWTVTPWVRGPDGSATLTLSKPFARVDEVPGILTELNGAAGPLRDARFTRTREFFATRYSARATLDPGAATAGVAADAELAGALAAQGVDVGALDQRLAAQIRDGVRIRLVVELPGRDAVAVTTGGDGAVTLDATSSVGNRTRIVGVSVAVGLVVLAVAVACWPRRRRPGRGDRGVRPASANGRRTRSAP